MGVVALAAGALAAPGLGAATGPSGPLAQPAEPSCVADADPMGCPIQTITGSGGIQVGDRSYPRRGNWVRLLVLSADRLEPVQCGGRLCDLSFDADETAELLSTLGEIPARSDDLVILSGQGISYNPAWPNYVGHRFSPAQVSALKRAFEMLGGTLEPGGAAQGGAESLDVGAWSLLGRAGAAGGFAEQNYETRRAGIEGFLGGSPGGRGSLNGYLQIVNTAAYEFVSPEFVSLDTSAPGSTATENVIAVGERSYRSEEIEPGEQAFQLVFLPNEPDAHGSTPAINATIVTRDADGSVDSSGVHQLAFSLGILRNSSVAGQLFGIVQSFGRTAGEGPRLISDEPEWVADQLPFAGLSRGEHDGLFDFYGWCGSGENGEGRMSGYSCDPFPNTPTSFGAKPTVTQIVGELAGLRARSEVANLGFPEQPEALSLIGPAHPYADNDVEVAVGAAGRRTIAVLRRSRQSQWTAAAAAPGPAGSSGQPLFDPAALWETVFGTPHEAWPLSGPPGSSLAEASRYLAQRLFPEEHYADVRQAYATAPTWVDQKSGELPGIFYPAAQRPHFSRADFEALKRQLATVEFPDLKAVDTMTRAYQRLFGTEKVDALIDFNENKEEIVAKALRDNAAYEKETATVDEGASVGSSLYFAADAIGAFGAETEPLTGPLDFFAGAYDFFSELYGSSESTGTAKQPFGEPQQLRDEAAKLAADMASRYQDLSDTFGHFEVLFDTDWGRLRRAAAYASGKWSLPPYSPEHPQLGLLQQSLATAGEAGLYEALVPLAYDQWVISPWWTQVSGVGDNEGFDPARYSCAHDASDEGSPVQPFAGFPASSVGTIRYEADLAQPYRNHFTARVLVSKADPLLLQDSGESVGSGLVGYPGVQSSGAPPEKTLTDKLFDSPTLATDFSFPDGLGLSQAGFLGLPTWDMPRLQCGMPLAYAVEEAE